MKRKFNPLVLILSGIIITVFIASSLVIALFSPELLPFSADAQGEATTEIQEAERRVPEEIILSTCSSSARMRLILECVLKEKIAY